MPIDWTVEDVAPEELLPHPENPRRGNVEAVAEMIVRNGWWGTLLVQRGTRHVLVGNHRLQAALAIGRATVPVMWADVDDDQARSIMLADNRASDGSAYDRSELVALLSALEDDDLSGTGWSESELDSLLPAPRRELDGPLDDEDLLADYRQAQDLRTLILVIPAADYEGVIAALDTLRDRLGVESNAEVIVRVVGSAA